MKRLNVDKELSNLFEELRVNWGIYISNQVESSDEEEEIIFKIPENNINKLILFDIPFNQYLFYRQKIFPKIRKLGYIPFLENDMNLSDEDINLSKLFYFIEKSDIIVSDFAYSKLGHYLENQQQDKIIIYIIENNYSHNLNVLSDQIVIRPKNLDRFSIEIENFIDNLIKKIEPRSIEQYNQYEFIEYFKQENYNAAVIFAFRELELKLNENYEYNQGRPSPISMFYPDMIKLAPNLAERIWKKHRRIRNNIVHQNYSVEKSIAQEIIYDIEKILRIIEDIASKAEFEDNKDLEIFFQEHDTKDYLKECFNELEKRVKEISPEIWLKVAKTALTFNDERVFLYVEPQKNALSLRVPLNHNEWDYLEPQGGGKYWPSIKLRDLKEIEKILPIIKRGYENRHIWKPYNQ